MSEFVKVRHADGREADITPSEVALYTSIGFDPVDGQVPRSSGGGKRPAAAADPLPAANGTDQRLDLILDELRGLRSDQSTFLVPGTLETTEPADGETVELREPAPNLKGMTRDELNAHAASIGLADPESFPNMPALIDAIRATEANRTGDVDL